MHSVFDTSIDIVSNTLFYLLTACARYIIDTVSTHALLPTRMLMFDISIDKVSNTPLHLLTAYVRYRYR